MHFSFYIYSNKIKKHLKDKHQKQNLENKIY